MRSLPFVENILADLRRFKECAEDNQDVDLDRDRFDLLTKLGLLERVQRSPARWMMTQAGEDAIAQPAAGEPLKLQHMAVAEDGELRWMTGRKVQNCELYAMPDFGRAPILFAAPPAAAHGDEAVRKDAERYRWLRAIGPEQKNVIGHYGLWEMDRVVDAMRAQGDGE